MLEVFDKMRMNRLLLVALWLLCEVGRVQAQEGGETSAAYQDTVRRAVSEYEAGHWDEARALFRHAHELEPNARTWRGLAITAFELRRYVDATRELEAALADTRKPLTEPQRRELEALLARARGFVSAYTLHVQPAAAFVSVDGAPSEPSGPQLWLDPGVHTVVFTAEGYTEQRLELRAEAGTSEELAIELVRPAQPAQPLDQAALRLETPARAEREPLRDYVASFSLAAASVLAGATAVTVGSLAESRNTR
ncbi:MAG TPA: tetratricopeptide repeat protein, partial [Polyangiales bacterium]